LAGAEEIFRGEKGGLAITANGYIVYDEKGKEIRKETGSASDADHLANLLAAIRENKPLNSEIEEGHKSTLLCHLGNIAHRVGRSLKCDPKDGRVLNDADANSLWRREYEKGWEPKL
jgi:hydroxymethylpyrimidine pyrophosphatase-like HAD family hydrolase